MVQEFIICRIKLSIMDNLKIIKKTDLELLSSLTVIVMRESLKMMLYKVLENIRVYQEEIMKDFGEPIHLTDLDSTFKIMVIATKENFFKMKCTVKESIFGIVEIVMWEPGIKTVVKEKVSLFGMMGQFIKALGKMTKERDLE